MTAVATPAELGAVTYHGQISERKLNLLISDHDGSAAHMTAVWQWFLTVSGTNNEAGRWYAWWSGAGADLGYLSVFLLLIRKHNCEVKGCWRMGRHGTPPVTTCADHTTRTALSHKATFSRAFRSAEGLTMSGDGTQP